MSESILENTKKVLSIDPSYTAFDVDIMMHINTVFNTLHQLGVGPVNGFQIVSNEAVWEDFIGNEILLNQVKSYIYIKVRMLFDPPQTAHAIRVLEEAAKEAEWRMNIMVETENQTTAPTS